MLTEDERLFRDSVYEFADREIRPLVREMDDRAAIVAQGVCAMVMTVTPFPQLAIYIGFTLNIFAVMSVASLMIFRRRKGWVRILCNRCGMVRGYQRGLEPNYRLVATIFESMAART